MTYREYLERCDEYEKIIIIANLARKHPNYDKYTITSKRKVIKDLLDSEIPFSEKELERWSPTGSGSERDAECKTGKWIVSKFDCICSECGNNRVYNLVEYKYCPKCGARMEVDE